MIGSHVPRLTAGTFNQERLIGGCVCQVDAGITGSPTAGPVLSQKIFSNIAVFVLTGTEYDCGGEVQTAVSLCYVFDTVCPNRP